eukprot:gene12173-8374_t
MAKTFLVLFFSLFVFLYFPPTNHQHSLVFMYTNNPNGGYYSSGGPPYGGPPYGGPPPRPAPAGYPPPGAGGYGAQPPGIIGYPQGPPMGAGVYAPTGPGGVPANPWQNNEVREWFCAVDQNGNGSISVPELNQALSTSGNSFSLATTERLLNRFDQDRDGEITYPEFEALHFFIMSMKEGFQRRDVARDGRLSGSEVREALASRGYGVSEETFQALMRKFDRHKRGSLAFDDYVELSIFLTAVRDTFAFYDRDATGQVVFNFDTFLMGSVSALLANYSDFNLSTRETACCPTLEALHRPPPPLGLAGR